ncbi:MAG TPA: macrocin O-methyltransferase [Nitrospinaceae bacterium]|nr:macrocin O-methyltransferase [Nitrospinaceae bacterium]
MFKNFIRRWDGRLRKYADRYLNRSDLEKDKEFQNLYSKVGTRKSKYTLTSMERCYSLYKAIQYITKGDILGDIVECGVWRGGSAMLAALTLIKSQQTHRKIYLYDTYEGMPEPTDKDIDIHGVPYRLLWKKEKEFLSVSLDEVKKNIFSTGYPKENIIFVKGMVQDTIPNTVPKQIALLRLDTDLYESTYHELFHLYPKTTSQGVIIIDDYGHFQGSQEATEKYLSQNPQKVLLHRIDYSCRVWIKPSPTLK